MQPDVSHLLVRRSEGDLRNSSSPSCGAGSAARLVCGGPTEPMAARAPLAQSRASTVQRAERSGAEGRGAAEGRKTEQTNKAQEVGLKHTDNIQRCQHLLHFRTSLASHRFFTCPSSSARFLSEHSFEYWGVLLQ